MRNQIVVHKKTIGILILIVAVLGAITYSFVSPNGLFSGLSNDLKEIEEEGEFMYTDLDGNPVSLVDYKGKILVINSWATWMPFSEQELQLLGKTKEKFGDVVEIIAINRMEDIATIRAYKEYITAPQNIIFLSDPTDNFYKAIQGYAMPETVIYNNEGVIINHTRGVISEESLSATISGLTTQ